MGVNNTQATQYAKLYNKEYNECWEDQQKDVKKTYEQIFTCVDVAANSDMANEIKGFEHGGFGPFSQRTSYREALPEDDITLGNDYCWSYNEFSKRIVIAKATGRTVRATLKDPISDITKKLLKAAYKDINKAGADLFNNPQNYVGGDGQALFSTAHTCSAKWSSNTTWSNLKTTDYDLTHDNMILAKKFFKQQLDLTGSKTEEQPSLLLVPDALEGMAFEITKSIYNRDNANMQVNQFGNIQHLCWSYIDDYATAASSNWFLLGDKSDHGLYMWFLEKPGTKVWYDENTKCVYLDCIFDYAVGYKHPRNVMNLRGY